MARIRARVQVHLPYDIYGTTASPGQVIEVETDHPQIIGYLEGGLLYALDPLEFPGELQPPPATEEDAAADEAADEPEDAQGDAETGASRDAAASGGDGKSESDEPQEPRTRPPRGRK